MQRRYEYSPKRAAFLNTAEYKKTYWLLIEISVKRKNNVIHVKQEKQLDTYMNMYNMLKKISEAK